MSYLFDICKVELEKYVNEDYIGICIESDIPKVVFPRGYNLSDNENELRKDINLLIKVLDKYKNRKTNRAYSMEFEDLVSEGNENNFLLSSAIWILKDYKNNGLYNNYINNYKVDKKGNINWERTIKKQVPYLSNKRFTYIDFITKEKANNINNIIRLIQKYILEMCIDIVGWLYPNITIEKGNKIPYSSSVCINILSKELQISNVDRDKNLIKHMISILKDAGNERNRNKIKEYKTKYFMNIWEDMLRVVLGNKDTRDYYLKSSWYIFGEKANTSNMKPDIIMHIKNTIYVIDAKYYKYGITKNIRDLPQSRDITKQLLYSSYINSRYNMDVYDAFILPYKSISNEIFKFVGSANINIDTFNEKKVVCILADTKKIMESYIDINNLENYKLTIKAIIDNENKNSNL